LRVRITVGVRVGMVRVRAVVFRNRVMVRVSSGLQLAGFRLWAGLDFRPYQ